MSPLHAAVACTAILGLLLFGMTSAVALSRLFTRRIYGYADDPKHWFTRLGRAQGNTAESAPMLAVLMLAVGFQGPQGAWVPWVFVAATAGRILHSLALTFYPSLSRTNVFRTTGVSLWLAAGAVLAILALRLSLKGVS